MSNKIRAETARGFIREKELILEGMRERANILNRHILILEWELKTEKTELANIEKLTEVKDE